MTIPPPAGGRTNRLPPIEESPLLMGWAEFNATFPTELDCREYMFKQAVEAGMIRCPRCSRQEVDRDYGDRIVGCRHCGKRWSFTAGTFFDRTRDARPWVGATWLMEHGFMVSSLRLADLVDVAYSTAWTILQKLAAAIESEMGKQCAQVPSSRFWVVMSKRSRETPARSHPTAEQEEIDKNALDAATSNSPPGPQSSPEPSDDRPDNVQSPRQSETSNPATDEQTADTDGNNNRSNGHELSGQQRDVYGCLSVDPIHFDALHERTGLSSGALSAALTMLEIYGIANTIDGNWYVRAGPDHKKEIGRQCPAASSRCDSTSLSIQLTDTTQSIVRFYRGTSRKYVQPYLARCWCQEERARWGLGAVMQSGFRLGPITYAQILQYVSPPMVKVFVHT